MSTTKIFTDRGARVEYTVQSGITEPKATQYGAWRFSFDNVIVSVCDEYSKAAHTAKRMAAVINSTLVTFLGRD